MTVRKGDYGKSRATGPLMTNIRLQPPRNVKVTKAMLGDVVDSLREGSVPAGWKFAGIEWRNPKKASAGWKTGTQDDLDKFLPVLNAINKEKLVESFRAALVRGGPQPGPKARQRLEKERVEARRLMEREGKARAKAVRERDALKTVEARRRRDREAEKHRVAYVKAQRLFDRLGLRLEGATREIELAADYKGKRGGRR